MKKCFLLAILLLATQFAHAQLPDSSFTSSVTEGKVETRVTAVQTDGKVIVGGGFSIVGGTEKNTLARLNADGTFDATFNPGDSGPNGIILDIKILADGRVLISGTFTHYNGVEKRGIARLNSDGTLDATFNSGGVGAIGNVHTIKQQSDGKILLSGSISSYNGTPRFGVLRLNSDGTLDNTFVSPFPGNQFVEEIDLSPDGRVVIGGSFSIGTPARVNVARLNGDGTLDTTFNSAGGGATGLNAGVLGLRVQTDGKVLIGGSFSDYNGTPRNSVARLNIDGTLDNTFTFTASLTPKLVEYFAIRPDGQIFVAGLFSNGPGMIGLVRVSTTGSITSAALGSVDNLAYHVTLQSDGKPILSGFFNRFASVPGRNLVRLNTNDLIDTGFAPVLTGFGFGATLARQTDGKIIVGGNFNFANGSARNNITRLNSDGTLDPGFDTGTGTYPDSFLGGGSNSNLILASAVQPDGKILIGGTFGGYNGVERRGILRLNSDGSLDATFNATGLATRRTVSVNDILVLSDGRIMITGSFFNVDPPNHAILRLNADGSTDATFNSTANSNIQRVVELPDGKFLIAGQFSTYAGQSRNRIARINSDGSLDLSFNPGTGANSGVISMVAQSDGKIVIGGQFTAFNAVPRNRIARLNADGTLDAGFDIGTGFDNTPESLHILDGRVIAAGRFASYNGVTRNRLARLNTDGSLDTSFVSGFDPDTRFFARRVIDGGPGKLLIGGLFKAYGGESHNGIVRIGDGGASAWWRAENNALDSNGVSHGTPEGNTTFAPGRSGQAFSFDGNGDSVSVPHSALFSRGANSPMTINLWAYRATADDRVHIVGKRGPCGGDPFNYQMGIHSGVGLHFFFGSNSGYARTTSDIIPVNQWTMLTGTFDGTTLRLYKDAQLVASQTGTMGPENTDPFRIGSSGTCADQGFGWKGRLDEVRFLDRALSQPEIQNIYAEAATLPQISGQITKNGVPLAGVSVALTGSSSVTLTTDANGNYAFRNLNSGGNYTVTPTLQHHKFTPISASFNNVVADQTQNFTAVENCHYTLARINQGFAASGGTGGVNVTAPAGCAWTAVPNQPWITVTTPPGSGNGGVGFTVAPNVGMPRTGTFTVVDQTFTINQAGVGQTALDAAYTAGVTESYNSVFVSAIQPDGKILIGGNFQQVAGVERRHIERLNPDGTRDVSFNPTNALGLNSSVRDIAIQPDGKIVLVGSFSTFNGGNIPPFIVRLNANGTRDTSFNLGTGLDSTAFAAEILPDGKVLIAGDFTMVNGVSRPRIARLNSDGTLDTAFNAGPAANAGVRNFRIQADGKIVVGGSFSSFNGVTHNALVRLNPDGSVDGTFNVGTGVTIDNNTTPGQVLGLAIQSDGKVLVGGSFNRVNGATYPGLVRLDANGSIDATFVRESGGDYVTDILVLANGQIHIAGGIGSGPAGTLRLNSNGSVDAAFQGLVVNDASANMAIQADGKLLLSGNYTDIDNSGRRNFVRLNTNGSIDTAFNPGLTTTGLVNRIVRQADGKALVMGNFLIANGTRRANIARFNTDGTLDASFVPLVTPPWSGGIFAAAVQPDGKILIGGGFLRSLDSTIQMDRIARLNANGTHDPTFVNGAATLAPVRALHVLPDGKILAGGLFNAGGGSRGLVRLNSNGSLDESFNTGTGANSLVNDLEVQPDGRIVLVGVFTQYNGSNAARVARLNTDGSLDVTFSVGTGPNSTVNDVDLTSDGRVLIAGAFTSVNSGARNRVARLNSDGTLDTFFNIGSGANGIVNAVKALSDGKIMVGGQFNNFDNQPHQYLVKLNTGGSIDNSYLSGMQLASYPQNVFALASQADGKVLVGGMFRVYEGANRDSLVRLSFTAPPSSAPYDFDGDGKTDLGIYRPLPGEWWINRSSNGSTFAAQFGTSLDRIAPGDYTGDGKADIAFYRPNSGEWYILRSEDFSFYSFPFGQSTDVHAPADYDDDGKTDAAVFRPSSGTWFIRRSSDNGTTIQGFGQNSDIPVPADYDGDGKADIAIYRPSHGQWWINRSSAGVIAFTFGSINDKPTPGDYTGDGKADVAFFRPSTGEWYVLRSEDFSYYSQPFGLSTDIPAPGDFDGDGRFDPTVFRPSTATWYSARSTAGSLIQQFGANGDKPIPNAFVP